MNNIKILQMIKENKIEELQQLLLQEVETEKAPNKNIYKTLLKLSKQMEKEQRNGKSWNGDINYYRPMLAGAYFLNNNTCFCNGYMALSIKGEVAGLTMVKGIGDYFDIEKVFDMNELNTSNNNLTEVYFNIDDIIFKQKQSKIDKKEFRYELNGQFFNGDWLLDLINALDNTKIYSYGNGAKPLYLVGTNGKALMLPIRIV